MRPRCKIAVAVIIFLLSLAGIQNPAQADKLFVATMRGYPVVSIGPIGATKFLSIFISPTCNYCNRLYIYVTNQIKKENQSGYAEKVKQSEITFFLFPRKEADVKIIQGLLCVDSKSFPKAVHKFYQGLWKEFNGSVVRTEFSRNLTKEVAASFGIDSAEYDSCLASEKLRKAVKEVFVIGNKYNEHDRVPIVVQDGKFTGAKNFYEVLELLK
jgi:hypothetical protein